MLHQSETDCTHPSEIKKIMSQFRKRKKTKTKQPTQQLCNAEA